MGKALGRIKLIFFNLGWYLRSLTWKKDDSVVIMDSWFGQKFADNPRFLFQYLSENKEELGLTHVVWVTRSEKVFCSLREMGYESYMIDSQESIHYHKIAKYHICNNSPNSYKNFTGELLGQYSFRAKRINLEHGIGLKGVSFAEKEYREKRDKHIRLYKFKEGLMKYKWFRTLYMEPGGWGDAFYLSSSPANSEILYQYFLLPFTHYIEADYPRTHLCLKLTKEETDVIETIKKHKYVTLYLPTFRTGTNHFDFTCLATEMERELNTYDILWIQKAHSADIDNKEIYDKDSNILTLNTNFDINVLMPYITTVVTDYSSISMDAIYHKKPVLYYVPDFDEYMNGDRGFVMEPEEYMAGPKLYTVRELSTALVKYSEHPEQAYDSHYEAVRNRYWKNGISYKEIWEALK